MTTRTKKKVKKYRDYASQVKDGDLVVIGHLGGGDILSPWCGDPYRSHYYAAGIVTGKGIWGDLKWSPGRNILIPTLAIVLRHKVKSEGHLSSRLGTRIFWNGHVLTVDPGMVYPLTVPGFTHEILAPFGELKLR